MIKKNTLYISTLLLVFMLQGCGILHLSAEAMSQNRRQVDGPTFHDHIYKARYGMSKEEVIEVLGPASEFKGNDVWIYVFPDDWIKEFYIRFENNKVVKIWN